jgi:hypothetical protein
MRTSFCIVLLIVLLSSDNCYSQTVMGPYEVGTWQGFRSAAISYTFDDNCSNQLALAVPMFNEFGFTLTLFTVTIWSPNWTGLQSAASHGHEIASHTVTHASLNSLSDSLQTIELNNSQKSIDAHIAGQKCVTIAYPNCNVGNISLVKQYYLAARGCSGIIESKTPSNFMNISSIICGSLGSVKTSADFRSRANSASSSGGWCVYLLHGIDNDGGYSPLPSDTLRKSLEYLKANPDKFWVTSFGNAAKYIKERNAASVSEISVTEGSITINVSDTLDNSYYDCPITVRRPLPQGWSSAYVVQNADTVTSQIVEVGSVRYLMFDVVPDDGNITLIESRATGIALQNTQTIPSSFELHQNYPNPFNPITMISFHLPIAGRVSLKVYDMLGQEIAALVDEAKSAGNYSVRWDAQRAASGVYFYQLQAGAYSVTKKLLLLK